MRFVTVPKAQNAKSALLSGICNVAQEIGFDDAEARRLEQARAFTRRRGNLVALNRGPLNRPMGI
jgi:hypothetical protein